MKIKLCTLILGISLSFAPVGAFAQSCSGPHSDCPEGQIYDPNTGDCADFVSA